MPSPTEPRDPANRDPLSGEPGAHPVGVGVGAAGGGAIGAGIGAAGGPIGAVLGAGIGAVAGGWVGKEIAESIDPTAEEAYWRENYMSREYVTPGTRYDDYHPAYRYGWESASRHHASRFEEVERDLERGWPRARDRSPLTWERAKHAVRDSWDRIAGRFGT
jgi:hypothetical protein